MNIEQRWTPYMTDVEVNDLEAVEEFYDTDFVDIRHDRSGARVTPGSVTSLGRLHAWRTEGTYSLAAAIQRTPVATSFYSDYASTLRRHADRATLTSAAHPTAADPPDGHQREG